MMATGDGGYRPFPEIQVEAETVAAVAAGVERALAAICARRPPELLCPLLRSAMLPFAALEAVAADRGIALPPVLPVHIGRELFAAWKEATDPLAGIIPPTAFFFDAAREQVAYGGWLQASPAGRRIVADVRRRAAAAGLAPRRVLILDDTIYQGTTRIAARLLLGEAFALPARPPLVALGLEGTAPLITPTFTAELARLRRAGALDKPYHEAQALLERADQYFIDELLVGYVETDAGAQPLATVEQLRALGVRPLYRQHRVYERLSARYGDAALLDAHRRARASLAAAVVARLAA